MQIRDDRTLGAKPGGACDDGLTLLEVVVSVSIFSVILLASAVTLLRGMEYGEESNLRYQAMSALRDQVNEIQEVANRPLDLALQEGIGSIYHRYNGATFAVPELPSGAITIQCFANEASVPSTLGGPQDLNFDGDAADDLGNVSDGTDLKLVPMTLTATFNDGGRTHTIVLQRMIAQTRT